MAIMDSPISNIGLRNDRMSYNIGLSYNGLGYNCHLLLDWNVGSTSEDTYFCFINLWVRCLSNYILEYIVPNSMSRAKRSVQCSVGLTVFNNIVKTFSVESTWQKMG